MVKVKTLHHLVDHIMPALGEVFRHLAALLSLAG
jgi:hypothetical protein